jgi:hypothetical protein
MCEMQVDGTHNWMFRFSSRSFPTSFKSIRTSFARDLLNSSRYCLRRESAWVQQETNYLPLARCMELARSRFHEWQPMFLHGSWPYRSSSFQPFAPTGRVGPRSGEQAHPKHVQSLRNVRVAPKAKTKQAYLAEIRQRPSPLPC